jgi:carbon-monoxide dehydrogenase medium subunit
LKAAAFDYSRPANIGEALALLQQHGEDAKVLAGGQSLLPALNLRLSAPRLLIDIGRIDALRGIDLDGDTLRIGALTRHVDLLQSALIQRHAKLICRAVAHVAHPAIRNRGTIGGSLANADPAAELPAVMLALDARIVLENPQGRRMVAAEKFFTGLFETAIAPDEILVAVEVPTATDATRIAFHELARRSGDYAMVGLAANAAMEGTRFSTLRLAYFSVGPMPVLAHQAAAALLATQALETATRALATDLQSHDDQQASAATRLRLAGLLLRRAVTDLLA